MKKNCGNCTHIGWPKNSIKVKCRINKPEFKKHGFQCDEWEDRYEKIYITIGGQVKKLYNNKQEVNNYAH